MNFFGIKKIKGDLKTLSEKEIQVKLYGHLRTPHPGAVDSAAVITAPKPIRPVVNGPQPRILTPDERKAIAMPSAPAYQKTNEEKKAETASSAKRFQPVQPKTSVFASAVSSAARKIVSAIFNLVKTAFTLIAQILVAALGVLTQFFLKIDYKNPRVRRAFYWTLGLGLLAFLLVGIHVLNVKREIAMKHPNRTISVRPKAKKKAAAIPVQVASQTAISEHAAEEQAAAAKTASSPLAPVTAESAAASSAASAPAAETPAPSQKGQVIQIATFAAQGDAEKLVDRLKKDGWPCFAKPLVRPGGKTYFCVFLGAFKTYQEAETKLSEFKKKEIAKPFQDAFIRSV